MTARVTAPVRPRPTSIAASVGTSSEYIFILAPQVSVFGHCDEFLGLDWTLCLIASVLFDSLAWMTLIRTLLLSYDTFFPFWESPQYDRCPRSTPDHLSFHILFCQFIDIILILVLTCTLHQHRAARYLPYFTSSRSQSCTQTISTYMPCLQTDCFSSGRGMR